MLGVVAKDERMRERIRVRLAAAGDRVRCFADWPGVFDGSHAFHALVAVIPSEGLNARWLRNLNAFRVLHPWVPIVLVVPNGSGASSHRSAGQHVEALVHVHEVGDSLAAAVDHSQVKRFLDRVARRFDENSGAPDRLHRAMRFILRADPPVRTVNTLAASMRTDASTLLRLWRVHREALGFAEHLGFKDLLAAIVVLRAVGMRQEAGGWEDVAGRLDIHVGTLRRRTRAWLGLSLAHLSGSPPIRICERLWARISV